MKVFCLGAPDPEMAEIVDVLEKHGYAYAFATIQGRRVISANAYEAHGLSVPIPVGAEIIFVECAVMGLTPVDIIDHHNSGDPGFEVPPERYMEGSSLGQLLTMLGVEPTRRQRLICAADHCLTYAYQGRCPGVAVNELEAFRLEVKAALQGLPLSEARTAFSSAQRTLSEAERVDLWGVEVAWMSEFENEFFAEASAKMNIPLMYTRMERNGRRKAGILGAPPDIIQLWMDNCGLDKVYGAPERGYAGGYQ